MPAVTFTADSDAVQGDDWQEGIAELLDLFHSHPNLVHVARNDRRKAGGVATT